MIGDRRWFIKGSGFPWLARWWPFAAAPAAMARGRNVYQELGIQPLLNFRGTMTNIGASKQWPELHAAMEEASRHYVPLEELQDRVGERLSRLIGSESAMVTTGAAGAISVGTAAAVAGSDVKNIRRLPDVTGLKNEAIIFKMHRNGYDHAVRNVGVRIVEVETMPDLEGAVNERTAMMYYLGGSSGDADGPEPPPLAECLRILHKASVPVMVDAANMLPPWENIRKLAAMGVDMICISGGKHMRGPQCSGILAGRKDLIHAARLNSNPHSDSLGRPMKAGREEMIGVWLACEKYAKLDFEAIDKDCLRQAEYLKASIGRIPGLKAEFARFDRTRKVRRVEVQWDEEALGITAAEAERQLWEGSPRIAILRGKRGITFTVFMNDAGDEKAAARRMEEIFGGRSGRRSTGA
jgi:L-seryl-tRNA(Ser) seleniumtransferase